MLLRTLPFSVHNICHSKLFAFNSVRTLSKNRGGGMGFFPFWFAQSAPANASPGNLPKCGRKRLLSPRIVPLKIALVLPAARLAEPVPVFLIPAHRFGQPPVEIPLRLPAQFAFQFRAIERVPAVVRPPVHHQFQPNLRPPE